MAYTDIKNKIISYDEFLNNWSIEKVSSLNLNDYTNLDKNSFTYDLEFEMRHLGSIKGGSSFKFGIYRREDTTKQEDNRGKIYKDDYAWSSKYGSEKEEVFNNVISKINDIISNSQKGDLQAIEKIELGEAYKWKIAFHYQNKNNISIVPIFTYEAIKQFLETSGYYKKNMTMADMYIMIKNKKNISTLDKVFDLAEEIWDDFRNLNISKEKELINNNKELNSNRKGNATSNLEYVEYEIKAQKIKYRNRHNSLEKSFENFLKSINADKIIKDELYIDFQFTLNKNLYICELKPTDDQTEIKYAVRSAVGQILGYAFDKKFDFKIIVFQDKPKTENIRFLEYLRTNHNIFYLYEVSEGLFEGNIL